QWILTHRPSTFRYFPGVLAHRITILTYEINKTIAVYWHNSYCFIFETDNTVYARSSGRRDNVSMFDPDPRIFIYRVDVGGFPIIFHQYDFLSGVLTPGKPYPQVIDQLRTQRAPGSNPWMPSFSSRSPV